jgi:hypothetical protein
MHKTRQANRTYRETGSYEPHDGSVGGVRRRSPPDRGASSVRLSPPHQRVLLRCPQPLHRAPDRACRDHDVGYSITVRQVAAVRTAIASIDDGDWEPIDYTIGGDAEVADCPYGDKHRLVVRRTRIIGAQPELFANWRHHGFITNSTAATVDADADHRAHAVVELAIRDLRRSRARALPVRPLPRQQRLGRVRHRRSQPDALGAPPRHRHRRPGCRQDDPPQAAHRARTLHPRWTATPTAPPRPLALAQRVPHHPRPAPSHPAALLTAPPDEPNPTRGGRHNQTPAHGVDPRTPPQRPNPNRPPAGPSTSSPTPSTPSYRSPDGEVGRWLDGHSLRLRSRPGRRGGVFQRTGLGPAAPAGHLRVASGPLSNRACGSPAHGSPTSFIVRHSQPGSAPFR